RARWHLLVKCLTHGHLTQIAQIAQKFQPKSGVRVHIDVDPYDIL
ncbi:MAG: hypothetical protein HY610_00190, partial [Elusimicrobia bacterium]|nr:hypothetical protein [Elusimicrobiota bacterium]